VQVYIGYAEMDISLMVSDEDFYARSLDVKRIGLKCIGRRDGYTPNCLRYMVKDFMLKYKRATL